MSVFKKTENPAAAVTTVNVTTAAMFFSVYPCLMADD
jgi:hypothetical protein